MTTLEVAMDILLPFITAIIIDRGLEQANLPTVYRYGALMVVMAFLGLVFAALAGKAAARASSGLAANLREAIYRNIQTFSFSNIDKFSVPGLVTRMTTDITNVQNAFMMVIRVAVRGSPDLHLQLHHVPDHQSQAEPDVPDRCCFPGRSSGLHHGRHHEDFQRGLPPV